MPAGGSLLLVDSPMTADATLVGSWADTKHVGAFAPMLRHSRAWEIHDPNLLQGSPQQARDGRGLQQNGAGALDCSNKGSVDLDVGDCTVLVHQSGKSSQLLQVCFNQREP